MTLPPARRPVAPHERILALDVLRGFAMLGVLLAYCMWSLGTAPDDRWSVLDKRLGDLVTFAVDGKFYTILAFLFGLGFAIQLGRSGDGPDGIDRYCRRLAVLAVIGLGHALLLRNGDILLPYALIGFLLIPFRHASARAILAAAAAAMLLTHAGPWLWSVSGFPLPQRPNLQNAPYLVENAAWVRYWFQIAPYNWPLNLTLFLLGLLAGRHGIVTSLSRQPRTLLLVALAGLAAGISFYLLQARLLALGGAVPQAWASLVFTLHCWAMSSAYAAAILLALGTRAGASLLYPLAAIGRMALTNYLMQAALIVPFCLVFGLFDTFTPTTSLLLALGVFLLVQLPFSLLWLRRFPFGPVEWLWRLLTYGRAPSTDPGQRTAHLSGRQLAD